MSIKSVTIAGGGTLGSQIAWQTAFKGFNVTVYDAFDKGIEASKSYHKQFAELFLTTRDASQEEIDLAVNSILTAELLDKQQMSSLALSAWLDELYGFGYNWSEGQADRIMAITLEDVKKVAKKYLTAPATVTIVSSMPVDYPLEKKEKSIGKK